MFQTENATVYYGSNLDVLPTLADNSVDSIVTDPPYELGFMGKSWDSSGIAYSTELWAECLRVLKPGGHLLAFSAPRTYHRVAVAIEDAGFEIRDMVSWISNKTFPKSHNISKAIDREAGVEREVIGTQRLRGNAAQTTKEKGGTFASATNSIGVAPIDVAITAPATDDAKKWEGWGTALKPTVEPIVMARKPFDGTIAANVLKYGTGGLNIDATRVGTETITVNTFDNGAKPFGGASGEPYTSKQSEGRHPANLIIDEHAAQIIDEQSGQIRLTEGGQNVGEFNFSPGENTADNKRIQGKVTLGGASRFFYVARASKTDRNEGLENLRQVSAEERTGRKSGSAGLTMKTVDGKNLQNGYAGSSAPAQNFHPTVKPTALMTYLIKLVTPPNGIVLDPFTGSGSTGKAALLNGFGFIGIELTEDYQPIIEGRLRYAQEQYDRKQNETLF